jgi:medium-chain acyl-[acyl-carrier-protein] hydrolase
MEIISSDAKWIVCQAPNSRAQLRMFCFPYAGGGASVFRNWMSHLPSSVELCSVQFPGREGRFKEPPFTKLAPLVEVMAEAIGPYLDKPFVIFGHSMGAIIAFEFIRLLQRKSGPHPLHFFASGCQAPQTEDDEPVTYNLPENEFLEELRRLNGTGEDIFNHPELVQFLIPLLRADFELVQTYSYVPGPKLECPITALGGLQDVEVPREHLDAWREQTRAAFSLRMLPGDHFFLSSSRLLLLRILSKEISQLASRLR